MRQKSKVVKSTLYGNLVETWVVTPDPGHLIVRLGRRRKQQWLVGREVGQLVGHQELVIFKNRGCVGGAGIAVGLPIGLWGAAGRCSNKISSQYGVGYTASQLKLNAAITVNSGVVSL